MILFISNIKCSLVDKLESLGIKFSFINSGKFRDSESYIRFPIEFNISKSDTILFFFFVYGNVNDRVIELLFSLKSFSSLGSSIIKLFLPYFPYCRQDRTSEYELCPSFDLILDLISHTNAIKSLYTIDVHTNRIIKPRSYNFFSLSSVPLVLDTFGNKYTIVFPDFGSYLRFRSIINNKISFIIYIKNREKNGSINIKNSYTYISKLSNRSLFCKSFLVIDDIIDSGRTLKEIIKNLKLNYPKSLIKVYCTHFLGYDRLLHMDTSNIFFTDTLPINVSINNANLLSIYNIIYRNLYD